MKLGIQSWEARGITDPFHYRIAIVCNLIPGSLRVKPCINQFPECPPNTVAFRSRLEHNVDIEIGYSRNPVFNTGRYNAKDIP